MNFKDWLYQFKDNRDAIFIIQYKDKFGVPQAKYMKGGITIIEFVEANNFKEINYIDRIC